MALLVQLINSYLSFRVGNLALGGQEVTDFMTI